MSNTWKFDVCHKLFMLILLLLVAPVLCGLDGMSDGGWQAGTSADFDDDLFAEFVFFASLLTPQGPVVNSPVAFLTLLASFPFLPPV